MREGQSVLTHLNEFNKTFSHVIQHGLNLDDEVKSSLLLVSLPPSWDTFVTATSNSHHLQVYADVESAIMQEDMNRQNRAGSKASSAMNVRDRQQNRDKDKRGKSRSKSRSKKDIVCFYCERKGHYKSQCHKLQADKKAGKVESKHKKEDNDKDKDKGKGKGEANALSYTSLGSHDRGVTFQGGITIEEIDDTVVEYVAEQEILYMSSHDDQHLLASMGTAMHTWLIDSGASFHVTPHREWFMTYMAGDMGPVFLGDDHELRIAGIGDIDLQIGHGRIFTLHDVRHVPELKKNLISTSQLGLNGHVLSFGHGKWKICKGSLVMAKGSLLDTLYPLYCTVSCGSAHATTELLTGVLWHCRLGHMSKKGMETLSRCGYLPMFSGSEFADCEHCIYGKQVQFPHKKKLMHKLLPLDLVHTDVCMMP